MMFGGRSATKVAKDTAGENGPMAALSDAIRIDRAGSLIGEKMPVLVQKLPSADEALGTIVGTAQRALDKLPGELTVPGRRRRRRRPPIWLLIVGGVAAASAAGFVVYRKVFGDSYDDEEFDRDWPAEPNPGTVHEKPESDAEVAQDAAESAAVLSGSNGSVDAGAGTSSESSH